MIYILVPCTHICIWASGLRPESSGGARVTAVLDSATKVLEISSLGIKARPAPPCCLGQMA